MRKKTVKNSKTIRQNYHYYNESFITMQIILSTFVLLMQSSLMPLDASLGENTGTLTIEVNNISDPEGIIWVGIYDSKENFMIKEKAIVKGFEVKALGKMKFDFSELKYGSYAIAIFHDINGNGELDRSVIGIPSEPYAFSKKPKTKWRLPRFDEIAISFEHEEQLLTTELRKWWKRN